MFVVLMIQNGNSFRHQNCWSRNSVRTSNDTRRAWKFNRILYPFIDYLLYFATRTPRIYPERWIFSLLAICHFHKAMLLLLRRHSHFRCYVSIQLNSDAKACFSWSRILWDVHSSQVVFMISLCVCVSFLYYFVDEGKCVFYGVPYVSYENCP